jgi:hypothetical protein
MKKTFIYIALALFSSMPVAIAAQQVTPLVPAGVEPAKYQLDKSYPLVDYNGKLSGTYQVERIDDHTFRYKVSIGGKPEISIDALTELYYSSAAGRLVTIGSHLDDHVVGIISVYFYDLNGTPLKKLEAFAQFPHNATLAKNGSLWLSGKDEAKASEFDLFLYKFNKNGIQEKKINLGHSIVQEMYSSEFDNLSLLIRTRDVEGNTRSYLRIYQGGIEAPLDFPEIPSLIGIEFLSEKTFVVCTPSSWFKYDISGKTAKISGNGKVNGNTITKYPVTNLGNGRFAIIHYAYPNMTGFSLEIIDASSKIVASHTGNDTFYKTVYRRVETENGQLKFNDGSQVIVFELPK